MLAPAPPFAIPFLAAAKSPVSVQAEPFHDSVAAVDEGVLPPQTSVDVFVPLPLKYALPVFKSLTSVQLDPLKDSVSDLKVDGLVAPPNANAAV